MVIGIDGNEANARNRVGSNHYAFELLRALYNLPQAQKHRFIIHLKNEPLADMPQLSTWWSYKVFGPKYFWTQLSLPLVLASGKQKLDIFFTPGHYRPRWAKIPTVISVMDLGYLQFPEQFTSKDLVQLSNWTARSIKKSNHILSISEATKRDIMKRYGIPSERITVTYPGYDRKRFHEGIKVQKSILEKYGINGDYILFLSTLKPSKNIEGLLEAFSLFTNHYSLITLVIAGKKGWLYEKIFEKLKELKLENRVVFTDYVDETNKPVLLAGAKALVSPSFWEGFGIHLVEAMACGCPVVASNIASIPEVVDNAGVLVNPNNPKDIDRGIQEALFNREIYIKRGLKQAKKFDWRKTAEQTLNILTSIVNK